MAAAIPRASTNGSTSRDPSGMRRPYGNGESGNVLVHARRVHAERREDVALYVIGPPSLRSPASMTMPAIVIREVRVLPSHRRARTPPAGRQYRRRSSSAVGNSIRRPVVSGLALQTRAVREQLLDGDRAVVVARRLRLEPGQVLRDRIVEAQLALLAQLHDGDGREQSCCATPCGTSWSASSASSPGHSRSRSPSPRRAPGHSPRRRRLPEALDRRSVRPSRRRRVARRRGRRDRSPRVTCSTGRWWPAPRASEA